MLESADATIETKAEAQTSPASVWRLWMDAIELASKEEEDWRKSAETVQQIYANSQKEEKNRKKFNILYANTETIVPAVYNSTPIPSSRLPIVHWLRLSLKERLKRHRRLVRFALQW